MNKKKYASTNEENKKKLSFLDRFFDYLSDCFRPLIGVILAASLIIALLNIAVAFGIIPDNTYSTSALFCKAMSKAVFYFISIMLAYNACKKFRIDPWLGLVVMLVFYTPQFLALSDPDGLSEVFKNSLDVDLVKNSTTTNYDNLLGAMGSMTVIKVFGIPMVTGTYSENIILPLIVVPILSVLYKWLKKHLPVSMHLFVVPAICIFIVSCITAFIIGPIFIGLWSIVDELCLMLFDLVPGIFIILVAVLYPILSPLGMAWPINMMMPLNVANYGYDYLQAPVAIFQFACFGVACGVFIKSIKESDKSMLSISAGSLFTGLFGGITNASFYTICLRYKKAYLYALIGCLCGSLALVLMSQILPSSQGIHTVTSSTGSFNSLLTIGSFDNIYVYLISIAFTFALTTFLSIKFDYRTEAQILKARTLSAGQNVGFADIDELLQLSERQQQMIVERNENIEKHTPVLDRILHAPISGKTLSLNDINDDAFASKALGEGIAVLPKDGLSGKTEIKCPIGGTIKNVAFSKHAYTIMTQGGIGVLIHIGVNTIKSNGEGFESWVEPGDIVTINDTLGTADFSILNSKDNFTPVIVTVVNYDSMKSVTPVEVGKDVVVGADIVTIEFPTR